MSESHTLQAALDAITDLFREQRETIASLQSYQSAQDSTLAAREAELAERDKEIAALLIHWDTALENLASLRSLLPTKEEAALLSQLQDDAYELYEYAAVGEQAFAKLKAISAPGGDSK